MAGAAPLRSGGGPSLVPRLSGAGVPAERSQEEGPMKSANRGAGIALDVDRLGADGNVGSHDGTLERAGPERPSARRSPEPPPLASGGAYGPVQRLPRHTEGHEA